MMLAPRRGTAAAALPLRTGCACPRGAQRPPPFSSTAAARADFTHVVIGGGVVGLAVARQLALRGEAGASSSSATTTLLLERHGAVGTETSSRNSEVIHAGIYYGAATLKARLCVRGKELLYGFCARHGVGHRRTGKWIVAQTHAQREALERIERLCNGGGGLGVPVRWVADAEVRRDGEGVRAEAGALESPTTGIVDAHGLMVALQGLFEDVGGVVALNSPVTAIAPLGSSGSRSGSGSSAGAGSGSGDSASSPSPLPSSSPPPGSAGWELTVRDAATGETSTVTAETIINAAGLGAADVHNMIAVPAGRPPPARLYYAKGNYFSYAGPRPRLSRLIYPAPEPGAAGLGTHLTLDLAGRMRFGPDVEWVDSPDDLAVGGANNARLAAAVAEIHKYLPGVDPACLTPDYAGIRPKLSPRGAVGAGGGGFNDFVIRIEDGFAGWVNLLGIESPGLTSSLAIGEEVERLLYGSVTPS
ncbi:hypothetical protein JDV02_007704 [Purpureocillium takamizusanense]|uniref:L-2-hydroxyglutarate dehydrogenase, mitochondrial n=1 Tax=Purpureocillium takamizusanense TaxID=2060973 RepID=A0A9Q8QIS2_9HYPO|nr:uncharacterized protein JDV02_007704 [Purpureocillium takamizusanense]UNI21744.1 hypothetical protein JDV02_007704 [Purpureocillium takamizusanense]